MVRQLLLVAVLVFGIKGFSQKIVVVDSIEKTPLSFVAVKYDGGGLYTNEIGQFSLKDIKGENIQLSMLGYNAKNVSKISIKDTIFLSPSFTSLDEITIVQRLEKKTIYKKPKKTNFFGTTILSKHMGICLILIPDSLLVESKVENLTFYFKRELGMKRERKEALESVDAFVRINIHNVIDEIPADQIFASEPIKISALKKDEIVLDLSPWWITIPKEGISLSIEMIGYYDRNHNEINDAGYVLPMLTPQTYEHFKAKTYINFYFPIDDQNNSMILMSDFLTRLGANDIVENVERNLSIGMTLSKHPD